MDKIQINLLNQKEYTFLSYEDLLFERQKAQQSLFNGSVFKNCDLIFSDFSQCDFEGTIFRDDFFKATQLSSCDIKSSYFVKCEFINCKFNSSVITDVDFSECKFQSCSFDDAILRDITFDNCSIVDCSFKMCTFTLSEFFRCELKDILLGNCSFYDHIMLECVYDNITINIDAVGRIYGLQLQDLKQFKYIFLGNIYGFAPERFFKQLDQVFQGKEWRMHKLLYKYNIGDYSAYKYVTEVFSSLAYFISNNIIVKRDDLLFLTKIIRVMKKHNELPMFALYQGIENLGQYINLLYDTRYINKEEHFREFINKMCFVFNDLLGNISYLLSDELDTKSLQQKIRIAIHYEGTQRIDFSQYINSFLKTAGYEDKYCCELTEIRNGSIIEIIVGTILAVYALQILIYGVNGVLVQITDMISKINVLKNKNFQQDFLSNSVKGRQRQPELIENTFELLKDKNFKDNINALAAILGKTNLLDITTNIDRENTL